MQDNRNWLKNYVMRFSYREKRNQKLVKFRQEAKALNNMDRDELEFEYVNLKSKYEHKKSVLTLFLLAIALAVLMDIWKKFFSFMGMVLQYTQTVEADSMEIIKVSLVISILVAIAITLLILLFLYTLLTDISKMRRKLMIIENVMEKRKASRG